MSPPVLRDLHKVRHVGMRAVHAGQQRQQVIESTVQAISVGVVDAASSRYFLSYYREDPHYGQTNPTRIPVPSATAHLAKSGSQKVSSPMRSRPRRVSVGR